MWTGLNCPITWIHCTPDPHFLTDSSFHTYQVHKDSKFTLVCAKSSVVWKQLQSEFETPPPHTHTHRRLSLTIRLITHTHVGPAESHYLPSAISKCISFLLINYHVRHLCSVNLISFQVSIVGPGPVHSMWAMWLLLWVCFLALSTINDDCCHCWWSSN